MQELTEEQERRAWSLGDALTQEIRKAEGPGMLGAHLGKLLRSLDEAFLLDTELKLADLLDSYAPELTVVGRGGHDLIWGLGLEEDAPDIDARASLPHSERGDERGEEIEWQSAVFRNYRSLRDTSIVLKPLTVLVGRNGAGKSNVLDALFRLSLMTRRKPEIVFSGSHSPSRVSGSWSPREGFSITARGTKGWEFTYESGDPNEPPPRQPFVTVVGGESRHRSSLLFTPMGAAFGGATYLRLDASRLQRATWSLREEPFLHHDGLFLPSVLAHVVQTDRARFEAIIAQVRDLVPAVEDLRTPWVKMPREHGGTNHKDTIMGNRLEMKMRGVGWIPADQLSEGTLLVLGLLTILTRPSAPRLLLLDDVDRGLHPTAQRKFIEVLQKFAKPRQQIVCTSHSPYILDTLPVSAVRVVVGAPKTGATSIHQLADHQEWEEWSDTMTPADFWQYVSDGDEAWPSGGA